MTLEIADPTHSTCEIEPTTITRNGVVFDTLAIATMLGELNTEAKCVSIFSTPQTPTPLPEIYETLLVQGAFDIVERRRFNVNGILQSMPDVFVSLEDDPNSRNSWAQKNEGFFGTYISGFAGALLKYSVDQNRGLRTIIGEKRHVPGELSSVEVRLGVLTGILSLCEGCDTGTFTKAQLIDFGESYGIHHRTIRSHIENLKTHKVLDQHPRNRKKLRTSIKPDGGESYYDVANLIRIVSGFIVASETAIERGIEDGHSALKEPSRVAKLIHRSYTTSTHTGKSTTRIKQAAS